MSGRQRKKATLISNNKRNKEAYSVPNNNYWSPLTNLVEELENNNIEEDEVVNQMEEEAVKPKIENKSELNSYRKEEPFGGNVGAIPDPVVGFGGDAIQNAIEKSEAMMSQMVNDFDQMANNITDLTDKMDELDEMNELKETEKTIPSPFDERGELNGVYNSAVTLGVAAPKDEKYLLKTGKKSHKVFMLPSSKKMNATEKWHQIII